MSERMAERIDGATVPDSAIADEAPAPPPLAIAARPCAREQFEALALAWDEAGRPQAQLPEGRELIALRCWTFSPGARAEHYGAELAAFVRAAERAQPPDWLDAWFAGREACTRCGETVRLEIASLCTSCQCTVCCRCTKAGPRAPNGNAACACGGELVG